MGISVVGSGTINNEATGLIEGGLDNVAIHAENLTLVNRGKILAHSSTGQPAEAIRFASGVNSLEIHVGSTIAGVVNANTGHNTLILGGADTGSFDMSQVGTSAQYQGFAEFQKKGAGTWRLAGESTQNWTVLEGKLEAEAAHFSGDVLMNPNTVFSFVDDVHTTYSGRLSGEGLFNKTGTGLLLLTGNSADFKGNISVTGGSLAIGDERAQIQIGGTILVGVAGTLGGSSTVGSGKGSQVTIASGGTLSPGNSIGTLTVNGDLVFDAGSRFAVETDPLSGKSDMVQVTGSATLNGGTVAHIGNDGTYPLYSSYTILSAQGGLTGQFDSVSSDFAFLYPSLAYDMAAGTVALTLRRNATDFQSFAATRNQSATAGVVESMGAGHAVYDTVAQLSSNPEMIRASFDALLGEIHGSARTALIEESRFVRQASNDRLRAAFGENAMASAMTSPAHAEATSQADASHLASRLQTGPVFWSQGFGSWGSSSSDGNAARLIAAMPAACCWGLMPL